MTSTFKRTLDLPVPAAAAFAWHERPGALERLIPPWERVSIVSRGSGIRNGSVVVLSNRQGPLAWKWTARHHGYLPGEAFRDTQVSGPFAIWEHLHQFGPCGNDGNGKLTDQVEFMLPGGRMIHRLCKGLIKTKIESMFAYRHRTTFDDLSAHARFAHVKEQRIAVTGSNGLIGSTLVPMLTTGGHHVVRLVRRPAGEREITWDPSNSFDASALNGFDAIIHLAGENIAGARWTRQVKDKIRDSRVRGTRTLCESLARLSNPPKTVICASAIGIYGDRGTELLTEASAPGSGFLADVVQQWEAATETATAAGIRVVNMRLGVVLSPRGGALSKMLRPFRLGGGGRVGSGRQFWSWISIDDAAGAIHHALLTPSLAGPVNTVAPQPVTNAAFTEILGRVLRRPTVIPMPAFAARLALGEMADELLFASTRVQPEKLVNAGYPFRQPRLEDALQHLLGKTPAAKSTEKL